MILWIETHDEMGLPILQPMTGASCCAITGDVLATCAADVNGGDVDRNVVKYSLFLKSYYIFTD